jgi:hypothetical protein
VSLEGQQGKPVEEQVEGAGRSRRRREGPDGASDVAEEVFSFEVAGDDRGAPGNQVGLARQVEIEGFEAPRGQ